MSDSDSPFRLLARNYSSRALARDQYVEIRRLLLRKLQKKGRLVREDLKAATDSVLDTGPDEKASRYSASDWAIIILGLTAAIVLGLVLYS